MSSKLYKLFMIFKMLIIVSFIKTNQSHHVSNLAPVMHSVIVIPNQGHNSNEHTSDCDHTKPETKGFINTKQKTLKGIIGNTLNEQKTDNVAHIQGNNNKNVQLANISPHLLALLQILNTQSHDLKSTHKGLISTLLHSQEKEQDTIIEGDNNKLLQLLDINPQVLIDLGLLQHNTQMDSIATTQQLANKSILLRGDNNTLTRGVILDPQAAVKLNIISLLHQLTGLLNSGPVKPEECLVEHEGILQQKQNNDIIQMGDNNHLNTVAQVDGQLIVNANVVENLIRKLRCRLIGLPVKPLVTTPPTPPSPTIKATTTTTSKPYKPAENVTIIKVPHNVNTTTKKPSQQSSVMPSTRRPTRRPIPTSTTKSPKKPITSTVRPIITSTRKPFKTSTFTPKITSTTRKFTTKTPTVFPTRPVFGSTVLLNTTKIKFKPTKPSAILVTTKPTKGPETHTSAIQTTTSVPLKPQQTVMCSPPIIFIMQTFPLLNARSLQSLEKSVNESCKESSTAATFSDSTTESSPLNLTKSLPQIAAVTTSLKPESNTFSYLENDEQSSSPLRQSLLNSKGYENSYEVSSIQTNEKMENSLEATLSKNNLRDEISLKQVPYQEIIQNNNKQHQQQQPLYFNIRRPDVSNRKAEETSYAVRSELHIPCNEHYHYSRDWRDW